MTDASTFARLPAEVIQMIYDALPWRDKWRIGNTCTFLRDGFYLAEREKLRAELCELAARDVDRDGFERIPTEEEFYLITRAFTLGNVPDFPLGLHTMFYRHELTKKYAR